MKTIWRHIKEFFRNIYGWIYGLWILYISPSDKIFSFFGYGHFSFARKYADKRARRNGLRHWVLPSGSGAVQLVVFNIREKKMLQHIGLMSKHVNINTLLNQAYYITPKKKAGSGETKKQK